MVDVVHTARPGMEKNNIYEDNDTFYPYQIAEILPTLLTFQYLYFRIIY